MAHPVEIAVFNDAKLIRIGTDGGAILAEFRAGEEAVEVPVSRDDAHVLAPFFLEKVKVTLVVECAEAYDSVEVAA